MCWAINYKWRLKSYKAEINGASRAILACVDVAVRRTGRLDKLIYVGPPDQEARRGMLALHLRGRPLSNDLTLEQLSKTLEDYSASDLRFLVDEAAREALKNNGLISYEFFQVAMRRVPPSISPDIEARYQSIQQRGL